MLKCVLCLIFGSAAILAALEDLLGLKVKLNDSVK